MNYKSSNYDDLLDKVIEHIRQQEIPPYPGWKVASEPRDTEFDGRSRTLIPRRIRFMKRPISGVAAALAIAIGSGIIFLNSPSRQGGSAAFAAFAEVQKAIGSSGSVKFHLLHFTGDDPPTVTTAMWLGPDRLRVELPGGDVIVEDLRSQET